MYQEIDKEMDKAELKGENVLISGDFNCKIGDKICGNNKEMTKSEKILLDTVQKRRLVILYCHETFQGLRTRIESNKKSVIDYVLINDSSIDSVVLTETSSLPHSE